MRTLEEYEAEEAARMGHLNKHHTDEQAHRRWLRDWYGERIEELCQLSDDPDAARSLYEQHTASQPTMWARLVRFKQLLIAGNLIDRALTLTIPNEPPNRTGSYEKQALFLE